MRTHAIYAVKSTPVKNGRMVCRIRRPHGSAVRLTGTLEEILDWIRVRCPGGKLRELWEEAA